jgi:hypothetical protein
MIKTLRITSVAAVILAAVVLATVLGYLRPASFRRLNLGTGADNKQIEKILGGPSAVDRFRTQYSKVPTNEETTPPLVKAAEEFANIINPPPVADLLPGPLPDRLPPPPRPPVKPLAQVSTKFDLLSTCYYSSNPQASFAYIRLPDNTYKWVGVGEEIGHVTIKEIHKGSIVCWDGKNDIPMSTEPTPETSGLLETANQAPAAAPSVLRPKSGAVVPAARPPVAENAITPQSVTPHVAPSNPSVVPNPAAVPPAQMSKEEQENLSRLGDRLKQTGTLDSNDRGAVVDRLISEHKSSHVLPPGIEALRESAEPLDESAAAMKELSRDLSRDQSRRQQYLKRLSLPRPPTN